ncbi:hypothetical protein [Paenibacillus glycinis]|uniref:Uncharacterized protein n=1 Tax=Paenibacillus glycinis TaxID=2697035 RepID=A0ABW9XQH4_9BACL|nr:hypothetical protein [Paenibacillus glycinis]NBD24898.1 hypothetical protein [Paenibacillus glycinis]
MGRIRPWVKKTLLVSVIVVAVGAGFSVMAGERGRDVTKVVRVSQEFHGNPAGDMKIEVRNGGIAGVPAPPDMGPRDGDGPMRMPFGGESAVPAPPVAPMIREGGIRFERGHAHGIGAGLAIGATILIAGLLLLWMGKRGRRSSAADGPNALAGIPTASDFLDQWEMQQNQTKESK